MPGATSNATVAQLCTPGYTATIRTDTATLKRQQIAAYGYADTNPSHYEEDHLIPLEIGGAPSDPNNLWPEPFAEARHKDVEENALHRQVCAGQMSLAAAQQQMLRDWS